MPTIYDCEPNELIEKASEELKKVEAVKAPEWAAFVKTGAYKERPPVKNDWWYVRSASVLRRIYRYGPIGVSKLRVKYGGKMNRGYKPERFYPGSGNIIRKILQQLEKAGFVKQETKDLRKGRKITANGKKFLDGIASKISNIPVQKTEKKKEKAAEPRKEEMKKTIATKKEPPKEDKEGKKST